MKKSKSKYTSSLRRLAELVADLKRSDIVTEDLVGDYPKFATTARAADFLLAAHKKGMLTKRVEEHYDYGTYNGTRLRSFVDVKKLNKLVAQADQPASKASTAPKSGKRPIGRPRKAVAMGALTSSQIAEAAAPIPVYRRADVFADAVSLLKTKANQAVFAGALDMISSIESREDREKFAAEVKKLTDR